MGDFQLHLDSKYADMKVSLTPGGVGRQTTDSACLFFLPDPVTLPSDEYELQVSVPSATIPISHWVVHEGNNTLQLTVDGTPLTINLPLGNRTIDDILAWVNAALGEAGATDWASAYDEATNRFSMASTAGASATMVVEAGTTSGRLLGLAPGDAAVDGVLTGSKGVDLAGTRCFYIRSSLSTKNRDPITRAMSNVLAKVYIQGTFNELQHYESSFAFVVGNRAITSLLIYLTDDEGEPVDLHGAEFSLTLQFAVVTKQRFNHAIDYRISLYPNNDGAVEVGAAGAAAQPGNAPDAGSRPQ